MRFPFRLTVTRRETAPQVMDRNIREGRDPWHGIANHSDNYRLDRVPVPASNRPCPTMFAHWYPQSSQTIAAGVARWDDPLPGRVA